METAYTNILKILEQNWKTNLKYRNKKKKEKKIKWININNKTNLK